MKKLILLLSLAFSALLFSMESEQPNYLKRLPKELKMEAYRFCIIALAQKARTFDEFIQELTGVQQFLPYSQELYNQLGQLHKVKYAEALARIQTLSKNESLAHFFSDPECARLLVIHLRKISEEENAYKHPSDIAKNLKTGGSEKWIRQLEFIGNAGGNFPKAKAYLANPIVGVNGQDWSGYTALMAAARNGRDREVVKLLLAARANVNAQSIEGNIALNEASNEGHTEIVELLLKAGADVEAKPWYGETALMGAAFRGRVDVVRLLIAYRADVNVKDHLGDTPLIKAAGFIHYEGNKYSEGYRKRELTYRKIVKLLLKAGADVTAKNNRGETALSAAQRSEEIQALLKQYASSSQ